MSEATNTRSVAGKIRVAIAGVGNCASRLLQGVEYYRNADPNESVPGLMHTKSLGSLAPSSLSAKPRATFS
jgi:Myo-inositol-1-phosphate synthase